MMLDLLDWKSRSQVQAQVRELLQQGALEAATTVVEELVAQFGDAMFVQAARDAGEADVDWAGVCAESIEADHRLRSLGETGCRRADLELGNQAESRLRVVRRYYGPARVRESGKRPEPWLGASHGLLEEFMTVAGLEQLAAVQLRAWPRSAEERQVEERAKMLAGHLVVLRFFWSVQRHAAESGLPVPVHLHVGVQSPLGGEDALTQLEPRLEMDIACSVRPITPAVEQRLKQRHEVHVARWHENTDRILRNLRAKFDADGYAPSFMIPDELVETKERLRRLEQRLLHRHFFYRLRRRGFEALVKEIREVRDRTAPAPMDPTPYR